MPDPLAKDISTTIAPGFQNSVKYASLSSLPMLPYPELNFIISGGSVSGYTLYRRTGSPLVSASLNGACDIETDETDSNDEDNAEDDDDARFTTSPVATLSYLMSG